MREQWRNPISICHQPGRKWVWTAARGFAERRWNVKWGGAEVWSYLTAPEYAWPGASDGRRWPKMSPLLLGQTLSGPRAKKVCSTN